MSRAVMGVAATGRAAAIEGLKAWLLTPHLVICDLQPVNLHGWEQHLVRGSAMACCALCCACDSVDTQVFDV